MKMSKKMKWKGKRYIFKLVKPNNKLSTRGNKVFDLIFEEDRVLKEV